MTRGNLADGCHNKITWKRSRDLLTRCHEFVTSKRGGNVVFHLRRTCDVAGKYRETLLRRRHNVLLPGGIVLIILTKQHAYLGLIEHNYIFFSIIVIFIILLSLLLLLTALLLLLIAYKVLRLGYLVLFCIFLVKFCCFQCCL